MFKYVFFTLSFITLRKTESIPKHNIKHNMKQTEEKGDMDKTTLVIYDQPKV